MKRRSFVFMGFIYKITNLKTNEIYIGQTSYSIKRRWEEHISKARHSNKKYKLYKSMRRYGLNNFIIETIEEVSNDLLNSREQYWIKFYNSCNNGLNMTIGGETFVQSKITQKEVDNWWANFISGMTVAEISRESGYCRTTISKYLKHHPFYKEMAKRNLNTKKQKKPYLQSRLRRNIYEYDLKGNLIRKIKLASFDIIDKEMVYQCAIGKIEQYKNKKYSFAKLNKQDIRLMFSRFESNRQIKKNNAFWYRYYKIS